MWSYILIYSAVATMLMILFVVTSSLKVCSPTFWLKDLEWNETSVTYTNYDFTCNVYKQKEIIKSLLFMQYKHEHAEGPEDVYFHVSVCRWQWFDVCCAVGCMHYLMINLKTDTLCFQGNTFHSKRQGSVCYLLGNCSLKDLSGPMKHKCLSSAELHNCIVFYILYKDWFTYI